MNFYTEQPWQLGNYSELQKLQWILKDEKILAEVFGTDQKNCESNARLIASAPKLLNALQNLVAYFHKIDGAVIHGAYNKQHVKDADDVIKQALEG